MNLCNTNSGEKKSPPNMSSARSQRARKRSVGNTTSPVSTTIPRVSKPKLIPVSEGRPSFFSPASSSRKAHQKRSANRVPKPTREPLFAAPPQVIGDPSLNSGPTSLALASQHRDPDQYELKIESQHFYFKNPEKREEFRLGLADTATPGPAVGFRHTTVHDLPLSADNLNCADDVLAFFCQPISSPPPVALPAGGLSGFSCPDRCGDPRDWDKTATTKAFVGKVNIMDILPPIGKMGKGVYSVMERKVQKVYNKLLRKHYNGAVAVNSVVGQIGFYDPVDSAAEQVYQNALDGNFTTFATKRSIPFGVIQHSGVGPDQFYVTDNLHRLKQLYEVAQSVGENHTFVAYPRFQYEPPPPPIRGKHGKPSMKCKNCDGFHAFGFKDNTEMSKIKQGGRGTDRLAWPGCTTTKGRAFIVCSTCLDKGDTTFLGFWSDGTEKLQNRNNVIPKFKSVYQEGWRKAVQKIIGKPNLNGSLFNLLAGKKYEKEREFRVTTPAERDLDHIIANTTWQDFGKYRRSGKGGAPKLEELMAKVRARTVPRCDGTGRVGLTLTLEMLIQRSIDLKFRKTDIDYDPLPPNIEATYTKDEELYHKHY
jgi:hypothetical protein